MPEKDILVKTDFDCHRLAERISKYATDAESGHIKLSHVISGNLRINGVSFFGILVKNCSSEYKDTLLSLLKNTLSECMLDDVKMWTRIEDLTDKFIDEETVSMFGVYRRCHPYNILLIYDPHKSINNSDMFYTIDFERCIEYERNRSNGKKD